MLKVKDLVLKRKKALQSHGGDTALQDLLLMLADSYEVLMRTNDLQTEDVEKVIQKVDQSMGGRREVMEEIANDLTQHEHALKRIAVQSTLLEDLSLGVRPNFFSPRSISLTT